MCVCARARACAWPLSYECFVAIRPNILHSIVQEAALAMKEAAAAAAERDAKRDPAAVAATSGWVGT